DSARVASMPPIVAANQKTGYDPAWGTLARAAGRGRCAQAIGPGAALALAGPRGRVADYRASLAPAIRGGQPKPVLNRCPLTMIDLGVLPAPGDAARRDAASALKDRLVGAIAANAPAGSTIVLAGLGDDGAPHLRVLVIAGRGYRAGLLTSDSTRQ